MCCARFDLWVLCELVFTLFTVWIFDFLVGWVGFWVVVQLELFGVGFVYIAWDLCLDCVHWCCVLDCYVLVGFLCVLLCLSVLGLLIAMGFVMVPLCPARGWVLHLVCGYHCIVVGCWLVDDLRHGCCWGLG